jgi:N-acyl-phosphatidylethanolamine-hydrolysing phospholipase D
VINTAVIGHNYYAHDRHQHTKEPNVQFFAPSGIQAWFNKCGIDRVTDLDA